MLRSLASSRLKQLNLSSNRLDDADAAIIGASLQENRCLLTLDLSKNRIVEGPGREGMRGPGLISLWQALKHNKVIHTVNVQRQCTTYPATEEEIQAVKRPSRGSFMPVLERRRRCPDFERDCCQLGASCPLAHKLELVSVVEVRPDKAATQLEEGTMHRGRLLILGHAEGKKNVATCTKPGSRPKQRKTKHSKKRGQ